MKKLVALLLAVLMVFGLMTTAFAAEGELAGKTVILHTNDVHGAVGLYAKVAALKRIIRPRALTSFLWTPATTSRASPMSAILRARPRSSS